MSVISSRIHIETIGGVKAQLLFTAREKKAFRSDTHASVCLNGFTAADISFYVYAFQHCAITSHSHNAGMTKNERNEITRAANFTLEYVMNSSIRSICSTFGKMQNELTEKQNERSQQASKIVR